MQHDKVLLTREGRDHLLAELEELRTTKRAEVAERLRVSREEGPGDAGDNTQYLETQRELALLEARIATIERTLASAEIVESSSVKTGVVGLGSSVEVKDDEGEVATYHLVGAAEANPRKGAISYESPVGHALLGKKAGDTVSVETPAGVRRLTIASVS
jgi:transcription elongation factor GreA